MLRMIVMTGLVWGLTASETRGADEETTSRTANLIKGIRYTYDTQPNSVKDKNHSALTDGESDPVLWFNHHTVAADFDLGSTYRVTRVEVDAYRGMLSRSRLRTLQLHIDNGAGHVLMGKMQDLAGANYYLKWYGYANWDENGAVDVPANIPPLATVSEKPVTFSFENVNEECYRLRLTLSDGYQPGWHFGITEVRIYGTPVTAQVTSKAASPEEQAGALKPYSVPDTGGSLIFQEGNFDTDAEQELFLANKYVTMVIEPSLGGVIGSFVYRGIEFTQPKNSKAPGGGGGFLSDHVIGQSVEGDWFNAPYDYKVVENTPERISIKLSATGESGSLQYLTFNKIITIWKDRSSVRVDYDIALDEKATTPMPFTFWFHNYAGTREDGEKSQAINFYVPEREGIRKLDWSAETRSDVWFNNPTRGWTALADTTRNVGLVFNSDYRYLTDLHSWGLQDPGGLPTLEWYLSEVSVPHGGSFKTTFTLTPFGNFSEISGASPTMAGTINYEKKDADTKANVSATLVAARKTQAVATLRYRVLPLGPWQQLLTKNVSLDVDKPLSLSTDFQPKTIGTHVFSLIVEQDGEELVDLEEPVSIGKPRGDYVLRSKVKRISTTNQQVNLQYISMDYETPHVKWARPYLGGKTKTLVLLDGRYQREVIELAQRMDLEFDSTYLFPTDVGEAVTDYRGKVTPHDLEFGLNRLLGENADWEVLVMAGHMFRYFTDKQRKHIDQRVNAGAGLVVVQPDATDPLPELSPLQNKGEMLVGIYQENPQHWVKEKDHFITNGIPWPAMPATDVYQYKVEEGADLLATAEGFPLVAVKEVGEGRVVAFGYRAGDLRISESSLGNYSGLTPFMTGEGGTPYVPTTSFDYHEYQFALLAKAILWAAQKEPPLLVDQIKATPDMVKLNVNNQGTSRKVHLDLTIVDQFGNLLTRTPVKVQQIAAGKSTIEIPVSVSLRNGVNLFDISIKDEQGRVINWASASLDFAHPVRMAEVTDNWARARAARKPVPIYNLGDTIDLEIRLEGEIGAGLSLLVRSLDGFDRVTFEKSMAVTSNNLNVPILIEKSLNTMLAMQVELSGDGTILATHEIRRSVALPLTPKPHMGEPTLLGWNVTASYGLNAYLFPHFVKILHGMGFNAGFIIGGDGPPRYREAQWRHNMPSQDRCVSIDFYRHKLGDDPDHPVRHPCLRDPEWLEYHAPRVRDNAANTNVFSLQAGDEASYDGRFDFCFSPHCMAAMRKWLKTEYPTLATLNAQWGTDFKSWDDVKPLTLKETKERGDGNYSSWCDHRSFGEMNVAYFYDVMGKAAAEGKAGVAFGPSGNPDASVYGGYDFWQLSKTLTGLWAYGGADQLSLWSRDRTKIMNYAAFSSVNFQRVRNYGNLFTGTSGSVVCGTQRLPAFDWTDSVASHGYREVWMPLKKGIGRLLHESVRTPDPIAVHYSRNASRVAHVLDLTALWRQAYQTNTPLRTLFESCGFDHNWISYEQLEEGKTEHLKVIFLPISFTLSDGEVAGLEKFVKEGGVLIGELGIGIADGHGKMLSEGRLDNVFGIRRRDSKILMRKDMTVRSQTSLGQIFPQMRVDYLESGLETAGAEVLATAKDNEIPVAFANQYGEGLAIYLACNFTGSYFTSNGARGVGNNAKYTAEAEDFITALAGTAGIGRRLGIEAEEGQHVPFIKPVLFTQGEINYFGILCNYYLAKDFSVQPVKVKLRFPTKGYIRELFSEEDYGLTDEVETVFKPTTLLLYSWVPYKVDGIELAFSKGAVAPGGVISYDIAVKSQAAPSIHTLRMGVFDPDGEESEAYSRNITAEAGKAKGIIPLALNDKQGAWKVQIEDVTSGKKTAASFVVE